VLPTEGRVRRGFVPAHRGHRPVLAANVKEWVWNEQAGTGKRYILGGAWNDPDYHFLYADSRSPFDRSETNGFRCVVYGAAAPPDSSAAPVGPFPHYYATARPVADDVYRIYADQYSYDRTPFDVRVESTDDASPHWRHETVSIATVYGGERMPVHLYLPKNVRPPYQGVLFFPGSLAIGAEANHESAIQHVFRGLHRPERPRPGVSDLQAHLRAERPRGHASLAAATRAYTTWVHQLVSDARRTLDYLGTRPDIDAARLSYYGLSWGGQLGPIMMALEPRLKAGILLMGGLFSTPSAPEVDSFTFASRVRAPILMLNGDQDYIFPLQTSQQPLFQALGTPSADKKHVLYPGGH
jgi:cephalosporin-C deacetylase-like acetyl esterase